MVIPSLYPGNVGSTAGLFELGYIGFSDFRGSSALSGWSLPPELIDASLNYQALISAPTVDYLDIPSLDLEMFYLNVPSFGLGLLDTQPLNSLTTLTTLAHGGHQSRRSGSANTISIADLGLVNEHLAYTSACIHSLDLHQLLHAVHPWVCLNRFCPSVVQRRPGPSVPSSGSGRSPPLASSGSGLRQAPAKWVCNTCTYMQSKRFKKCSVCSAPQPKGR